jgi:hypothetical protein
MRPSRCCTVVLRIGVLPHAPEERRLTTGAQSQTAVARVVRSRSDPWTGAVPAERWPLVITASGGIPVTPQLTTLTWTTPASSSQPERPCCRDRAADEHRRRRCRGDLVLHVRMDGAWRGSVDLAINKAFTARAFDITTAELAKPGGQFYGIQASNKGKVMVFAGRAPVLAGGVIAGTRTPTASLPWGFRACPADLRGATRRSPR